LALWAGRPDPEKLPDGAIWAQDADEYVVGPFAGNNTAGEYIQGPALEAGFGAYGDRVQGMVFDQQGDAIIACDSCIVRVDTTGRMRFLAGVPGVMGFRDGSAERALFSGIRALVPGPEGLVYVLDRGNRCIRQLVSKDNRWFVETVAGGPGIGEQKYGAALEAGFHDPCNLAINSKGELFSFDNNRIRKIARGRVETVPVNAKFNLIMGAGCCFDDQDNLYVADRWSWVCDFRPHQAMFLHQRRGRRLPQAVQGRLD